jgi:hypothetical protein
VGVAVVRGLIGALGVLLVLGGIGVAAVTGPGGDLFSALFLFVPGAVLIAASIFERNRYRSLSAERRGDGAGRGGGETGTIEPRFRVTDERFVDPTTGVRMVVFVDPSSGERRYVPEA